MKFAVVIPQPTEWRFECPACGRGNDVPMVEVDDGSMVGAFDGFPGNAFTECECGQRIEVAAVRPVTAKAEPA